MAKQPQPTRTAPPAPLQPDTDPAAPRGRRIETNMGQGLLRPGAYKDVRRTGTPAYCGAMMGRAFGYMTHPNNRDATRTSIRFAGEFLSVLYSGEIRRTTEAYLPSSIERSLKAALDLQQNSGMASPIEFGVEVWCEPDPRETSTMGFRYACYDRRPETPNDPLMAIAYETGMISRPAIAGPRQAADGAESDGNIDPETGEVS